MRVISKRLLREFWTQAQYKDSESALKTWHDVSDQAQWKSFADVKQDFGKRVDQAHKMTIFDISGNKYRLICLIDYVRHGVLVRWIGTHRDYDTLNERNGNGPKNGTGMKDL